MTKKKTILELERLDVKFNPNDSHSKLSVLLVGAKLADKPEVSLPTLMANRATESIGKAINELSKAIEYDRNKSARYNKIISELNRLTTRI